MTGPLRERGMDGVEEAVQTMETYALLRQVLRLVSHWLLSVTWFKNGLSLVETFALSASRGAG